MEKVRPWCGQPSDRGRLMNRTEQNLGKPAPEKYTIRDFTAARDDGVAVASAGPYANHLHLAPDR